MSIDIVQLASQVAPILIPYLVKGGEAFASESGKKIAEALWGKFKPKIEAKETYTDALQDVKETPDDKNAQASFELQIKKILEKDSKFAEEISITVGHVTYSSIQAIQSVVSRDVENSNILNNSNNNRIVHAENYYEGAPKQTDADNSPEGLTLAYLRNLAQECEKLPLGVIHRNFQKIVNEDSILLQNVYTDLDVQPRIREERGEKDFQLMEREEQRRVPVLSALEDLKLRRLVLLGDPGSGKTTCVHYLTFALAMIQQKLAGTESLLPENSTLTRYFPIRLVLREVAALHIPNNARTGSVDILWKALRADLTKRIGEEQAKQLFPHLQKRIQNTPCLIMLDGLDEVPESEERRARLLESIEHFSASLPQESIVLVTARPYAYDDPKWKLPHFESLELLSFSEEQIEGFIKRFYQAVRVVMDWDENTATRRGDELNGEVQKEEYLQELAERPLLLTLIATVDTSGGKLPEDRADLYEETVGLLLQRWQRRIETRKEDGSPLMEESIVKALSIDNKKVRDALHKLAYQVHERQGREKEAARKQNAPADIRKEEILGAFASLLPEDTPIQALLAYLETRAGLLLGRGEGVYMFPHRSFQEYLAACYLNDQPNPTEQLNDVFLRDADWWREVVLLGIAKIQRGGLGSAVNAVNTLVPCDPEDMVVEETKLIHWQAAALAGQALLEMRLKEKSGDQILYKTIIKRVVNWLVQLLEGNHLTPRERAEAGDTLAKLSDPRFDENNWQLPKEPLLGFVHIPAGEFLMGTKKEDIKGLIEKFGGKDEYYTPEVPQHVIHLPDYYMARYPITVAQFKTFVEDSGYKPTDEDSLRGVLNHPVRYVTWYDALAYCEWLNKKLKEAAPSQKVENEVEEKFWRGIESDKLVVTLPSEAEWEKAARGVDGRIFPWNENEITPNHANYGDTNINNTSAVGSFPLGKSPYEIHDMSGNVWEWMRSEYKEYPFDPKEKLKKIEDKSVARVVRGGAYGNGEWRVRCAFRDWNNPDDVWNARGFRVVVASLPISLLPRSGS